VIVRKEEKTYGATGRVTGAQVNKGDSILFFDDVVSEGLSKLEGMKPLEELGAHVKNIMVVVDREQGGKDNLQKFGYKIHALTQISELVKCLRMSKKISENQANTVLEYIRKK
jgi:uridine monophosphate synthetase